MTRYSDQEDSSLPITIAQYGTTMTDKLKEHLRGSKQYLVELTNSSQQITVQAESKAIMFRNPVGITKLRCTCPAGRLQQ
jgi:hypothetical protein